MNAIEIAKEFCRISVKLLKMYKRLSELEMLGQNDSHEYQSILENLNELFRQEALLASEISDDIPKAYEIAKTLFPHWFSCLPDELEFIKRQDENNLVLAHIGVILNNIIVNASLEDEEDESYEAENENDSSLQKMFDRLNDLYQYEKKHENSTHEEDDDFQEDSDLQEEDDLEEEFAEDSDLEITIEDDIIQTVLTLLSRYILNEKNENIKRMLVNMKAYIAFVYPEISDELLKSGFKVRESLVWMSYIVGNTQSSSSKEVKSLILDYIIDIVGNQIDSYYDVIGQNDPELRKSYILFTEIVLRACIMFFNDIEVSRAKELYKEDIEAISLEADVKESLKRVFDSRQEDQSLPYVLSLDPKFFSK